MFSSFFDKVIKLIFTKYIYNAFPYRIMFLIGKLYIFIQRIRILNLIPKIPFLNLFNKLIILPGRPFPYLCAFFEFSFLQEQQSLCPLEVFISKELTILILKDLVVHESQQSVHCDVSFVFVQELVGVYSCFYGKVTRHEEASGKAEIL